MDHGTCHAYQALEPSCLVDIVMTGESCLTLYQQASVWAGQLRTDSSFTVSDAEELKGHLLDISEDLVEKGLSEEEAFAVAIDRLGDLSVLRNEFEESNAPAIQLRKATLVLSGILAFFLLYYFIFATTHLLVLGINHFSDNYVLNFRLVQFYLLAWTILIIIPSAVLFFSDNRKIKLFSNSNIRPIHTFLLFLGLILFSLSAEWFGTLCELKFNSDSYSGHQLYYLLLYLNYVVPLVLIVSFITLYQKYSQTIEKEESDLGGQAVMNYDPFLISDDLLPQKEALERIGLNNEEIQKVLKIRCTGTSTKINEDILSSHSKGSNYDLLLIFSSVLVYFFLDFLLRSASIILIYLLQHHENEPALNIRRTFSFMVSYQSFFVLLTAALYFLDKNIVQRIKQLHFKPIHTLWMLLATILFAFLELVFLPLAKNSLGKDLALRQELMSTMHISDHTFPLILCGCFLVLFQKYYRDNIKTA